MYVSASNVNVRKYVLACNFQSWNNPDYCITLVHIWGINSGLAQKTMLRSLGRSITIHTVVVMYLSIIGYVTVRIQCTSPYDALQAPCFSNYTLAGPVGHLCAASHTRLNFQGQSLTILWGERNVTFEMPYLEDSGAQMILLVRALKSKDLDLSHCWLCNTKKASQHLKQRLEAGAAFERTRFTPDRTKNVKKRGPWCKRYKRHVLFLFICLGRVFHVFTILPPCQKALMEKSVR